MDYMATRTATMIPLTTSHQPVPLLRSLAYRLVASLLPRDADIGREEQEVVSNHLRGMSALPYGELQAIRGSRRSVLIVGRLGTSFIVTTTAVDHWWSPGAIEVRVSIRQKGTLGLWQWGDVTVVDPDGPVWPRCSKGEANR